jgi:hypothetical protein
MRVVDGPDAGKSGTTDGGGRYAIGGIAPGNFTLSASAASYLTRLTPVAVASDTRVDVVLSRCRYNLSSHNQTVPSDGGSYEVQVTADGDCQWTATPNVIWITITRGVSGTGNGSIAFAAAANRGAARTGAVTVAGETLTVAQAELPPPPPPPTPSPAPNPTGGIDLTGNWSGSASDSQGGITVSWTLTQSGSAVSGTVRTQSVNPADGSCNSCHRNKSGTVSGTISGTTLSLTMFFAAQVSGDPTPMCSATLSASASSVASRSVTTSYTGSDTCEGAFTNGTMAMHR